jgi:hypothetical protein
VRTKYENIPEEVVALGKKMILDAFGGAGRICFDPLADISKLTSALPR